MLSKENMESELPVTIQESRDREKLREMSLRFTYNIVTKTFMNQSCFIVLTGFDSHSIISSDV